jgi:hypothetical protein
VSGLLDLPGDRLLPTLPEGTVYVIKIRCRGCGKYLSQTRTGALRRHVCADGAWGRGS